MRILVLQRPEQGECLYPAFKAVIFTELHGISAACPHPCGLGVSPCPCHPCTHQAAPDMGTPGKSQAAEGTQEEQRGHRAALEDCPSLLPEQGSMLPHQCPSQGKDLEQKVGSLMLHQENNWLETCPLS